MLQSSVPIPSIPRDALASRLPDAASVREAEDAIRVAYAMAYALRGGAFSPRIIKTLRKSVLGMSQDDLAQQLFCTQRTVSYWESGDSTCPPDAYLSLVDLVKQRLDRNAQLLREGRAIREQVEHD